MKFFRILSSLLFVFVSFSSSFSTGDFFKAADEDDLGFSHSHGFYYDSFILTISSEADDAKIRYTLDGTNPMTSSSAFVGDSPVSINIDPDNTTNRDVAPGYIVTACATVADTLVSDIVTQTYLFPDKITSLSPDNQLPGSGWLVPGTAGQSISYGLDPEVYNDPAYSSQIQDAFLSIPTMSLVTDLRNLFDPDSGIYLYSEQHGIEWERRASLELIYPDGSEGFSVNCGIRIRGGWSRHDDNPKSAFRVFFRDEYGPGKLDYSLFGDEGADEFDKVDLRTAQNYSWSFYGDESNTFLRDIFSRDTQRDMEQPYTRSRYYHLYINGSYWGLYQTQERSEANYGETYFGGTEDDYDVIKVDVGEDFNTYLIEATDGTLDKWRELWEAGEEGFSDDELYFKVQGLNPDGTPNPAYEKLLDVDNLIDYMLVTFFVGDFDGPVSNFRSNNKPNNFYAMYSRVNPDGFKFFRHDAEHSLFPNNSWGIDRTGPFPAGQNFMESNPQWIHQKLSENIHYRLRFADRAYKHFFNNGALILDNNLARLNKRKQEIETAIIAESARWGDSKTNNPRTKEDWNEAVEVITDNFLPGRVNVVVNQLKSKGLFPDTSPPQFNVHGGKVDEGFSVELSGTSGEIYYTTNGSDPYSPFGSTSEGFSKVVIETSASKKVVVPKADIGNEWYTPGYNDSQWLDCTGSPGGVGYETSSGYESYISLSVRLDMYQDGSNPNTSCYIRIPFNVEEEDLNKLNFMYLDIIADDGFVAYLNGTRIAEENAPSDLSWNSTSVSAGEAEGFTRYNLSAYTNLLNAGTNLLAIHGLNASLTSSDFLILPELTIGDLGQSGTVSPDAVKYENPFPITETVRIKTRSLNGGSWSALNEAVFIINQDLAQLKVTELHYHPVDNDTINDTEYEFIELKNIGSSDINMNTASFVNGIYYNFDQQAIIPPGGFLVLASNSSEFNNRYGFTPFGEYEGQLDNGGERITLIDGLGDTSITFRYNDTDPWPEEADGDGYSLVSRSVNPQGDPNDPAYWTISGEINGSPGSNDIVSDVKKTDNSLPTDFMLYQNYPNPFNPETKLSFVIGHSEFVKLKVYDILGREIATLVNEEKPAGKYTVDFNIQRTTSNRQFSSGVYFYSLKAGDFYTVKKMLLLK